MFACKSHKHYWSSKSDAEKCCDPKYKRVLVFGGGDNQQRIAGESVGRAWAEVQNMNFLDIIECDPVSIDNEPSDPKLVEMGMDIVKKLMAESDRNYFHSEQDTDCTFCGERPALNNAQICPDCYLKEINELKPLSQNEFNILEADFFNWPRPTQLTYADGRNQDRVEKIEKLRLAMLPPN